MEKKEKNVRILIELFLFYRPNHLNLQIQKEAEKMPRLDQRLSKIQWGRNQRHINGPAVVLT